MASRWSSLLCSRIAQAEGDSGKPAVVEKFSLIGIPLISVDPISFPIHLMFSGYEMGVTKLDLLLCKCFKKVKLR